MRRVFGKEAGPAWLATGAVALAAFIVASTWVVVRKSFHPVLYKDAWETIPLFEAFLRGEPILGRLWEPWYQHQIFFPKILYFLDFLFAGMTGGLLVSLNLALQAGVVVLVALALRRELGLSRAGRAFAASLAVCACFWLVQSGNFLWGFQIAWFLNGFAALSAAFLACGFRPEATRLEKGLRLAGAGAGLIVASFSLANGVLMGAPLLALLWKAGASRRILAAWTALWIATGALFYAGVVSGPATAGFVYSADSALRTKLLYVPVFLGNPFSRLHLGAGMLVGAAGLCLFAAACLRWYRSERPGFLGSLSLAWMAYAVATAAATAAGRSYYTVMQATSSRYYTTVILFWLFAALWCGLALRRRALFRRAWAIGFMVVAAVLVAGQLAAVPERRERYLMADHAALALASAVDDSTALRYIQEYAGLPALRRVREQEVFLKEHGLSLYRDRWFRTLGAELAEAYRIEEGQGLRLVAWEESPRAADATSRPGRFVTGVIEPAEGKDLPERLLLVEGGRVTGFAATRARGCAGCFSGYASGPGAGPVGVYVVEDGSAVARPVEIVLSP